MTLSRTTPPASGPREEWELELQPGRGDSSPLLREAGYPGSRPEELYPEIEKGLGTVGRRAAARRESQPTRRE